MGQSHKECRHDIAPWLCLAQTSEVCGLKFYQAQSGPQDLDSVTAEVVESDGSSAGDEQDGLAGPDHFGSRQVGPVDVSGGEAEATDSLFGSHEAPIQGVTPQERLVMSSGMVRERLRGRRMS